MKPRVEAVGAAVGEGGTAPGYPPSTHASSHVLQTVRNLPKQNALHLMLAK